MKSRSSIAGWCRHRKKKRRDLQISIFSMKVSKKRSLVRLFARSSFFSRHFLSFRSSLLAGVFALVVGECQVTLIDSELISVAVRRADWRRA